MTKSSSSPQSDDQLDDDMDLLDQDLSDTDDWDDSDMSDETPPPKKKKGGMFNIIVIGLGVLAFLGIMAAQMASTPPQTGTPTAESPESATADSSSPPASSSNGPQPDAAVPQPGAATGTPTTEAGPLTPMPEFEATETPASSMGNGADPSASAGPVDPASANANTNVTTNMGMPAPAAAIVPPVVTLTPNDSAPVAVPPMSSNDPKTGVTPDLSGAEKDGGAEIVTAPVNASAGSDPVTGADHAAGPTPEPISATGAATSPTPSQSNPDDLKKISELSATVQTLTDRVAELESQLKKRDSSFLARADSQAQAAPETRAADGGADAGVGSSSSLASSPSVQVDQEEAAVREARKKRYVLRAVSNGTAYISSSMTSPVISVQVGEDVDGFGRVKDIRLNKSGRWQVVTTAGVITAK